MNADQEPNPPRAEMPTPRPRAFSAADLRILATPLVELQKEVHVNSFDLKEFESRLKGEDWQRIIQGHLYFDHILSITLTEGLSYPSEIDISRMGFASKLQLVSAMGLMSKVLSVCFRRLNSIRNKIAHELSYVVTDEDRRLLTGEIPPHIRKFICDDRKKPVGEIDVFDFVLYIGAAAEADRQRNAAGRIATRKAELRLRAVLDRSEVPYAD